MGTYYDPEKVKKVGKYKDSFFARPSVASDEKLIGVLQGLAREVAPDLSDPKEYEYFFGKYSEGYWLTFNVYAVPKSRLDEIKQEN